METRSTDKRMWTWVSPDGKSAAAGMSLKPGIGMKPGAGGDLQPFGPDGKYLGPGELHAQRKTASDAPKKSSTPKDYSPVPDHDDGGAAFYKALRYRESSDNTSTISDGSHIGLYQMGAYARRKVGAQDAQGNWTGKFGNSEAEFLASPELQEQAAREWHGEVWQEIQQKGLDRYVGQTINGVEVTPSGMIAAAHLRGVKDGLKPYLESAGGRDPEDGNHTKVSEYMKSLGGYPVPFRRRRR